VADFLPPRPAGPEPELGRPAPPPSPPPAPPQAPAPTWSAPPQAVEPDNGAAVTGFVLSIVGGGLLIVSAGLSSIVSIGCSVTGIVYSLKGKRKVDAGETTRNRGLAQAGFIIGIVSLVLAAIATLIWTIVVIALATDEEFREDFEDEFDEGNTITAMVRIAAACGRLLLS
jgi:hypothetical protein